MAYHIQAEDLHLVIACGINANGIDNGQKKMVSLGRIGNEIN